MDKLNLHGATDPFAGKYVIVLQGDPTKVIREVEISSKVDFDTILEELNKYNNESSKEEKRILLKADNQTK